MVQEENTINDGADEQMLSAEDNEKLAAKREEVKFIKGDQQNGDAKVDIGNINVKVSYNEFYFIGVIKAFTDSCRILINLRKQNR